MSSIGNSSSFTDAADEVLSDGSGVGYYSCVEESGYACAANCSSLYECESCQCVVARDESPGGPGGQVGDFFLIIFPVIFLLAVTVKPNPMPTTRSLPVAAALMFLVRLMYLGSDPLQTCGAVILGLHEALTPLSIVAGAMFLFETMESTYCMPYMMREIKALTAGHPIAEAQLIFAFAYMVEGASGFGTPAALGAPMLVSTGHKKLESVVALLLFNTFATVWGAVGTPLWFGFGELQLSDQELIEVSYKSATALAFGGMILLPLILTILVPFRMVLRSIVFVYLSVIVTIGPSLGLAFFSYEFPSLMGGLIGTGLNAFLIAFKVGLQPLSEGEHQHLERNVEDIGSVCETSLVARHQNAAAAETASSSQEVMPETVSGADNDPKSYRSTMTSVSELSTHGLDASRKTHSYTKAIEDETETDYVDEEQQIHATNDVDKVHDVDHHPDSSKMQKEVSIREEGEGGEEARRHHSDSRPSYRPMNSSATTKSQREIIDEGLGPRATGCQYVGQLLLRTFPIWGVVVVLIITRVGQIGIKPYLTMMDPAFEIYLNTYGLFRCSASLVLQLRNILTYPNLNWKYEVLYVPFIVPFVLISLITIGIYRKNLQSSPWQLTRTVASRLTNPAIALMGALVLVQLLIRSGESSPASVLGDVLAAWFRQGFVVISPILGALGSFFSGSTTVSNLTFGPVQKVAAEAIGISTTSMLALQAVGASAGNGVCLNNIIAACTVVGLSIGEGKILIRTAKYVFLNLLIALVVILAFYIRF